MSASEFIFLDKLNTDKYLEDLFRILHSNMSEIAPTGNSYEEDFAMWSDAIIHALEKAQRQIVLMYIENTLAGYFQYYINSDTRSLMMEEIQIKKAYQGSGLFTEFYKWLLKQLSEDIMYVEAFANKKNLKSQGILTHMGLKCAGENKNGNSFYYKGNYADVSDFFNNLLSS